MRLLLFILPFLALNVKAGDDPKIEVVIFNQRCIPIEDISHGLSFYEGWYGLAHKYNPKDVPILTSHDIEKFDIENFEITISEQGWKNISELEIPTRGIPIFLVINGEVAYGAWFWTPLSSAICKGVSFEFLESSKDRILKIRQGFPDNEMRIPSVLK